MSITSEIERLSEAKADIAAAIEEHGVSVAGDATLDEYGGLVRSISGSSAVLLWSGAKASGANAVFNIAAENGETGCTGLGNLSDYKLFIMIVAGNIPYLMSKANDESGLAGGLLMYSSSEMSLMVRGMRADVSGNTFTVTAHKTFKVATNTNTDAASSLNAIYGIPVKEA